ncbi:MAG: hypothetical protein MR748_05730 [Clostridiales bacterium]|nr:hypothetical protein [Clostridiales bacterium]
MIQRTACLIARGNEACRNLAIEKHLMDTLPDNTAILFLYQNRHAIVVGRNQNPWYECKVESFLESGGDIVRRLSGGGASYQDLGTLNFSLILPKSEFNAGRQLHLIGEALSAAGIPWEIGPMATLRWGGRTFCQNAFYKSGSAALHHGTILIHTALDMMEHYVKTRRKAPSLQEETPVQSRMVNLRELNPEITPDRLERALVSVFARSFRARPVWLDEQLLDAASLERLTASFAQPEWTYPAQENYDFDVSERFPWGSVTILLRREGGVIRRAKIFSDAMEAALFFPIEEGLAGCPFLIGAIETRFDQKLALLRDPRLIQIAGDVCTLLCGRIRAQDRSGMGA